MALVNYSDSEGDYVVSNVEVTEKSRKRKRPESTTRKDLPPLPDAFLDLYASNSRIGTQDDPSLHGGRHRVIPHIEGNWPTHVYIEWYPNDTESAQLSGLLVYLNDGVPSSESVHSLMDGDFGAQMPLHISLSRSIMLPTDQRHPFVDLLKELLSESGARPFRISAKDFDWVPNHEKTRWFLVMQLLRPSENGLNRLLWASNRAADMFGHPSLYVQHQAVQNDPENMLHGQRGHGKRLRGSKTRAQDPSHNRHSISLEDASSHFHISIGWSLQQPAQHSLDRLNKSKDWELGDLNAFINKGRGAQGNHWLLDLDQLHRTSTQSLSKKHLDIDHTAPLGRMSGPRVN